MSLVNVPPLAYAIEFLSSAGVQEIFVFATAHAEQIQQFVRTSIWKDAPNLSIHVVVGRDCVSAGDALREIDARQLIKDDFVLINADVISNMKLDAVLAAHKARRAKDKHAILTMVFKEVAPHHRTLSLEDDLVVALDASTGQLLHYDNDFASRDVQLDTAAFADHRAIELRHDLIDTRIDICAPELLFQFTDNFDYQDLRADFLHGVVTSEILGNSIHTHVIKDEYAARMKDLRTYAAVSTDIVHRWAFPMVPDLNWWQRRDDGDYKLLRRSVYRDRNVTLNRTAVLGGGTVVGGFTTIGAGSRLENCIIGRRCVIGDNVQLSNCFLWDGVHIENNVRAAWTIMCDNVQVGEGASIGAGCVLSFNVRIGANYKLEPHTKLTQRELPSLDTSFEDEEHTERMGVGGAKLTTFKWFAADPNDRLTNNRIVDEAASTRAAQDDFEDMDPLADFLVPNVSAGSAMSDLEKRESQASHLDAGRRSRASSSRNIEMPSPVSSGLLPIGSADDSLSGSANLAASSDVSRFGREVAETVHRMLHEEHSIDNLALEVNGLKFAYNKTFLDCARAVLNALLSVKPEVRALPSKQLLEHIKADLKRCAPLLKKYLQEHDDQIDAVYTVQEVCEDDPVVAKVFAGVLHQLYDVDVVSEAAVLAWAQESKSSDDQTFLKRAAPFLEWLAQAEEEEDEEDDDD
jgi:translation initiation factor eIF-2B subunit epsilon